VSPEHIGLGTGGDGITEAGGTGGGSEDPPITPWGHSWEVCGIGGGIFAPPITPWEVCGTGGEG